MTAVTTPTKDTMRDLLEGTLPWPQTRRLMSGYKDDSRFFTVLQVLQERVAWPDTILLPLSDHLFITDGPAGRVTRCECGQVFGPWRRNWKLGAHIRVRDTAEALREIYPTSDIPDPAWMEIREFVCQGCGTLHEVEACAPGYPIVHDFEPDLEAFYADWLKRPLRPEPQGDGAAA